MSSAQSRQDGDGPGSSGAAAVSTREQNNGARVQLLGSSVPLDWLVNRHEPNRYPAEAIVTPRQQRTANRDAEWGRKREQMFAAAAAGVHLALFSYNLAFWGTEGMPPDRYWPEIRWNKLGIKPGRYGNVEGTRRVYYDKTAKYEGVDSF